MTPGNGGERRVRNVGLLTLPFHANYGGIVQGVALARFLEGEGYKVTLLERVRAATQLQILGGAILQRLPGQNIQGLRGRWLRARPHHSFINRYIPRRSGPLRDGAAMTQAVAKHDLDAVVVGSDQVWRAKFGAPGSFLNRFLDFVEPADVRRIAYAASFGDDTWIYPEQTETVRGLLARFSAVSVREASGVAICAEVLGRPDAQLVLDPTLLIAPDFWTSVAGPVRPAGGRTLRTYLLDDSRATVQARDGILASLGPDYTVQASGIAGSHAIHDLPTWLRFFRDADFVVTDSFHGTVFSIIFRKNFVSFVNKRLGADRFTTLLGMLGLSDRLVFPDEGQDGAQLAREPIDYGPVMERLRGEREKSARFLRSALS